jgi:ActR/RegA family two-component response regulator
MWTAAKSHRRSPINNPENAGNRLHQIDCRGDKSVEAKSGQVIPLYRTIHDAYEGGTLTMHSQKQTIILLVSEDNAVRQLVRVLGGTYAITRAGNLRSATAMIDADPHIAAIIAEQGGPTGDGIESLDAIRSAHPQVRRIMLTSYGNLAAIVNGLHSGAVQSLVQNPISDDELLAALYPTVSHSSVGSRRASL